MYSPSSMMRNRRKSFLNLSFRPGWRETPKETVNSNLILYYFHGTKSVLYFLRGVSSMRIYNEVKHNPQKRIFLFEWIYNLISCIRHTSTCTQPTYNVSVTENNNDLLKRKKNELKNYLIFSQHFPTAVFSEFPLQRVIWLHVFHIFREISSRFTKGSWDDDERF